MLCLVFMEKLFFKCSLVMYCRRQLLLLFFFAVSFSVCAQGIRGTVRNSSGEPLPFASIYIASIQNGASSNMNGEFEIKLPKGSHTVIVRYIGYETLEMQLEVDKSWIERDIILQEQDFVLREVQVRSKAEDPAYTIMRKAIAKRKYHMLQYNSYQVNVYMKGTGEVKNVPFFLRKKLKEEGVLLDEAYTTESVSEISFEQPDKVEEKVISVRTTGESGGSPSPTLFTNHSFYKEKIADIISPLARSAFSYYKFRYIGSSREGNVEVNKIKVTPRSRGEQVFEGYIYIIENLWAIHSLDLTTSLMGFRIGVKQNYAEVAPQLWMPVTHQFHFSGKVLGFAGEYRYFASSSNYRVELNQELLTETDIIDEKIEEVPEDVGIIKPKEKDAVAEALANEDKMTRKQFRKMINQYEKEALKEQEEPEVISERKYSVDSLATKRDSDYWESVRPVPLTKKEQKGYQRDDSLAQVQTARITGKDSTGVIKKRKFNPAELITGGDYNFSPRTSFKLDPTFAGVYFNTVEGVNLNISGRLRYHYDSLRSRIDIMPVARYGFASQDFYAKSRIAHRYKKGALNRNMYLEGGRFVEQFNEDEPIHPHINTLATLLFRKNYMKIYEKQYLTAGYDYEPSAAFRIKGSLEWARRNQLFNHTDYSFFFNDTRVYSSNEPRNIELEGTGFPQHEALVLKAEISYRPGLKYRIYNGRKIPLLDNSPELLLKYHKGIPRLLGSDVNFDQIELGINHGLSFGVRGKLEYELRGGTFLNNKSMFFMDYNHFDGNRTILSSLRPAGAFRLLDYYAYSTNSSYFSGHTHYQFRKFLLTQLPELRFSGLRENIFLNYLKTANSPHYYELGYSIDQIMRIFRVEVAASFENTTYRELGLRIGIATIFSFNSSD